MNQFSINSFTADSEGNIVLIDWCYGEGALCLGNQLNLAQPPGSVPIDECTTDVLIDMVTEQIDVTPEQLDAQLSRKAYENGLTKYVANDSAPPSVYEPPAPPEPEDAPIPPVIPPDDPA